MTSAPMRDQLAAHLITPQNVALLLIPNQPAQLGRPLEGSRAPAQHVPQHHSSGVFA